jgi:ATP-binding cassette subfamily B protein
MAKETQKKKLPVVKTVLSQVKEFKTASFLTPFFMLLEVVMEMIIPLLMASIIDDGVNKGNMKHIILVGIMMIIVACLGLFAGIMGGKYGALASTGLARNLRATMFRKINTYSFGNIDKFSTASLVTRMTTDVTNIQNAYQMILRMGVRAPFSMIIAMVLSFTISPRLASVYLYAVIILAVFILIVSSFARKYFDMMFKKYDELNNVVQENINGIRVVKAYVREEHEMQKFTKISNAIYKIGVKVETLMATLSPVMMSMVYGSILLISWLGAKMIVQNELMIGQLMSLLTY